MKHLLVTLVVLSACDCQSARPRWRHPEEAREVVEEGEPNHVAQDGLWDGSGTLTLGGHIGYGAASHDLVDEQVLATAGEVELGRGLTDDEGRVSIAVASPPFRADGPHRYRLTVQGDGSVAEGTVYRVGRGAPVVVFDVDGTLTTDDAEVVEQMLLGSDPEMHPDADQVARERASEGLLPVYVTGRPYPLIDATRRWLTAHGFPPGPVFGTGSLSAALPTEDGVGRFKQDLLTSLQHEAGVRIAAAYGNAATDVCAYVRAGVPPEQTFIIGPHGGEACDGGAPTQRVESYTAHLADLRADEGASGAPSPAGDPSEAPAPAQ